MSLTQEMVVMLGPRTGKLYRVHNPFGIILGFLDNTDSINLQHDDIIMVVGSKIIPDETSNHRAFVFSIVKGDKLYENLLAFPVWFNHNFKLIQ